MYTTAEVAQLTGATARQLDHWIRQGYLGTGLQKRGTGHQRKWDQAALKTATAIAQLVRAGLAPAQAADIAWHGNPETVLAVLAARGNVRG